MVIPLFADKSAPMSHIFSSQTYNTDHTNRDPSINNQRKLTNYIKGLHEGNYQWSMEKIESMEQMDKQRRNTPVHKILALTEFGSIRGHRMLEDDLNFSGHHESKYPGSSVFWGDTLEVVQTYTLPKLGTFAVLDTKLTRMQEEDGFDPMRVCVGSIHLPKPKKLSNTRLSLLDSFCEKMYGDCDAVINMGDFNRTPDDMVPLTDSGCFERTCADGSITTKAGNYLDEIYTCNSLGLAFIENTKITEGLLFSHHGLSSIMGYRD